MKIILIVMLFSLVSCGTTNLIETENYGSIKNLIKEGSNDSEIGPDDIITLSVFAHDDLSVGSVYSIYNSNESYGKWILVQENGYAKIPGVGVICVAGLTCDQTEECITEYLKEKIVDPMIEVKKLNREITIVGEVKTPGTHNFNQERTTLTEVIGAAEGFTKYAETRKIQLFRNQICYELDFSKFDENFVQNIVVKDDDLINIPSKKAKKLDEKAPTIIPFASAITSIAVLYSVLK